MKKLIFISLFLLLGCTSNYTDKDECIDGKTYDGYVTRELCRGSGIKSDFSGNTSEYVGTYLMGKYHGKGKITHSDGRIYVGQFRYGKAHGKGKLTTYDGTVFEGEFINDKIIKGIVIYSKIGAKYAGEFENGQFSGKGSLSYSDGSKYEGQWKENKKNGKGTLTRSDGTLEEGIWKDNVLISSVKIKKKQKNQHNDNNFKNIVKIEPKSEFPYQPINLKYKSINKRPNDVAVIIGNANYEKQGKDIPNVNPAYADAEGIKKYFMQALGVKEGNIIYLKDATAAKFLNVFGNQNTHKGQLFNWVKKASNVYVYYAGHGVSVGEEGNAYLVPTDANAHTIGLSGYPLEILYSNLGKLRAKSITVILEACFSGVSQAGNLFSNSSPILIVAKKSIIPKNVKVISAGAVDQMASWEKDKSHSLFTKYFLKAMSGEGDQNKDGKVSDIELKNYLDKTMTYYARRYYGRDQNVQIMQGN